MNLYADLFVTFARIGLFTFGGGYAMIPLIEEACVKKKHWLSPEEMLDITVIAGSTPGPVAINCATFAGFKQRGVRGALSATLGMVFPSFAILYLLSLSLEHFLKNPWVDSAMMGIKIAVGILILDAGLKLLRKMQKSPLSFCILFASLLGTLAVSLFSLRISSIVFMLASGLVSLSVYLISGRQKGGPVS